MNACMLILNIHVQVTRKKTFLTSTLKPDELKILYHRWYVMQEAVRKPPMEISMGEHDSARTDPFTEGRIWGSMCPKRNGAVF